MYQCSESASGSIWSVCFWASRIRITQINDSHWRTGTGPVLRTNVSRATGPSAAGISSGAWARRRRGTASQCRAASPTTSSWRPTCKYLPGFQSSLMTFLWEKIYEKDLFIRLIRLALGLCWFNKIRIFFLSSLRVRSVWGGAMRGA